MIYEYPYTIIVLALFFSIVIPQIAAIGKEDKTNGKKNDPPRHEKGNRKD